VPQKANIDLILADPSGLTLKTTPTGQLEVQCPKPLYMTSSQQPATGGRRDAIGMNERISVFCTSREEVRTSLVK
jgi:hypothetical protein